MSEGIEAFDPTRFDGSETFAALDDPTRDWDG